VMKSLLTTLGLAPPGVGSGGRHRLRAMPDPPSGVA
jgi:hypothetical protein